MDTCPTIRIKPSHPSQGDFVEINAGDFNPDIHEHFDASDGPKARSHGLNVAQLKEALEVNGIDIPEGAKKADLAALLDAAPEAES